MNFDITNIFGKAQKPPVKIKVMRSMSLVIDGKSRHADAGEELEIPHSVFQQLDPSDYQLTSAISPTALTPVADPTPILEEPAPLPAGWDKLPKCFHDWHRMNADLVVARKHIGGIRETRRMIFGTDIDFSELEGTILTGNVTGGPHDRTNFVSTLHPQKMSDPTTKKLARYLAAGLAQAEDWLDRLREKTNIPLQKAFFEAGIYYLGVAEQLQAVVDEINATGYQIFAHRISALGLHDLHVQRLFGGSADYARFHQPPVHVGGRCFGGMGDDGVMRVYSDQEVTTSAAYALRDTARIAELTPLLATARKELSAAQKVARAA